MIYEAKGKHKWAEQVRRRSGRDSASKGKFMSGPRLRRRWRSRQGSVRTGAQRHADVGA